MPTAPASSLTEHGPACSRPSMRTLLGAANACMVSATTPAKSASRSSGERWDCPCAMKPA